MIEKCKVADPHFVAHEIACLVVAHAEPWHTLPRRSFEIVDGDLVGL